MTGNNEFKAELYERFSKVSGEYSARQRAFILELFDKLTREEKTAVEDKNAAAEPVKSVFNNIN